MPQRPSTSSFNWLQWPIYALAFILPLWFLPLSTDPFLFQKQALFMGATALLGLVWIYKMVREQRVVIATNWIIGMFALLLVPMGVSAFLAVNTPMQLMLRFALMVSAGLFLLFGSTITQNIRWSKLLNTWLISGVLLAVVSLLQLTPWKPSAGLSQLLPIDFGNNAAFTPAGSVMALLQFLVPTALAGWIMLVKNYSTDTVRQPSYLAKTVGSLLVSGTVVALTIVMLRNPDVRPAQLPFAQGWAIAVENFKNFVSFLFGVGPENFLAAFHRFRNVGYNTTDLWNLRFSVSSSEALHALTTTGILGVLSWLGMFAVSIRQAMKLEETPWSMIAFLATLLVFFLITPFNVLTIIVLAFILLALNNELRLQNARGIRDVMLRLSAEPFMAYDPRPRGTPPTTKVFAYTVAVVALLLLGLGTYSWGRVYAAELAYYQSLQATVQNDGATAYTKQQRAIQLNPYRPLYRRAYASTNLAIARNLSQLEEPTEEQQQLTPVLVEQALRESRNAVALDPITTENWETLAGVYRELLQVEGADQWALASYTQAIQTDPISPALRLALAGLYSDLEQPVQAQRLIEQAIQLKPDWANAYFNYGVVLEAQEEIVGAYQSYQQALQLLPQDAQGREELQAKLDELRPKAEEIVAQQQQQAQQQAEQAQQGQIPTPEQPQVPEQPEVEAQPDGFEELVNERNLEQASPSAGEAVVLPEDVGF